MVSSTLASTLICCNVHWILAVVQSPSHAWFFVTPWTAACQASLSFTVSQSLIKFMSIESVMASNHLTLCHPLLLLPSIFPSMRIFSSELALLIRWPKYWNFSFSISPSNEYSGLISFRIHCFHFLLFKRLSRNLQHHNLKPSILLCPVFFMFQVAHPSWLLEKSYLWLYRPLLVKWCLCFLITCLGLS